MVDDQRGGLVAVFGRGGEPVHVPVARLGDVHTLYALAVHRSQGNRGTFGSVKGPQRQIRACVDGWNDRRFVWTKTADQILKNANRQTTSKTDH